MDLRWFDEQAEHLRYEYDLDANSVVFDLGAYHGEFAAEIHRRYGCRIYSFEPVPRYLRTAARACPAATFLPYAVGGSDRTERIWLNNNCTSICNKPEGRSLSIKVRSLEGVLQELGVMQVDLIKINTEGCEFETLEHMLERGLAHRFRNIQVQFHEFVPDAKARRQRILDGLAKTHTVTWSYEFVWENHRLK